MSDNEGSKLELVAPKEDDGGAIGRALTGLFGRSYRTTIAGILATVSGGVAAVGVAAPQLLPHQVVVLATVLGPLFGGAGLMAAKDSRISGGRR
jgi:hypothetical protein